MGIIKQGILGGFSGKVGGVIGTSWKGRAVMKARPLSVANPKTAGQVAQRNAFTGCVKLAQSMLGGSVLLLDNPFAGNISGYNRFVSRNTKAFDNSGELQPLSLVISEGNLGVIGNAVPLEAEGGDTSITIELDSTDSPLNLDTDNVVVAIVDADSGEVLNVGEIVGNRTDSSVVVPLNEPVAGRMSLYAYISAVRTDNKYVSDSVVAAISIIV